MSITKKKKRKTYSTQKKLSKARNRVAENSPGYKTSVPFTLPGKELSSVLERNDTDLLSIKDAAEWASEYLRKNVTH